MKMRSSILRGLYTASITVVLLLIVKRNMNILKCLQNLAIQKVNLLSS